MKKTTRSYGDYKTYPLAIEITNDDASNFKKNKYAGVNSDNKVEKTENSYGAFKTFPLSSEIVVEEDSKVNIPNYESVKDAKKWVDENEK